MTVQDPAPSGLFLHSAQPSQGTCTLTVDQLVCRLGSLVSGGQALVSVTYTVAADASGSVVNEASVFGDQRDPHPSNNIARSAITVTPLPVAAPDPGPQPIADLVVIKHVNRSSARVGQKLTYTIKVTNAGPNAAHDVQVPRRVKAAAEGDLDPPDAGQLHEGTADPLPPRNAGQPRARHDHDQSDRARRGRPGQRRGGHQRQLGPRGEKQPGARQDQDQAGRHASSASRHGLGLSPADRPSKPGPLTFPTAATTHTQPAKCDKSSDPPGAKRPRRRRRRCSQRPPGLHNLGDANRSHSVLSERPVTAFTTPSIVLIADAERALRHEKSTLLRRLLRALSRQSGTGSGRTAGFRETTTVGPSGDKPGH